MKFLRFLLPLAMLVLITAVMSNSFDLDLGWHLAFGQAFWNTGHFPYLDTSTWTYAGRLWVNHEWGGDLVNWMIYQNFGYFSLVAIMSLTLWAAFLGVHRAFKQTLTVPALVASLVGVWFIEQTIVMRLAMLTPLFLVLTLAALERATKKRIILIIPALIYLWSLLHGSWILGFAVMFVYAAGILLQNIMSKSKDWQGLRNIVLSAAIAAPLPLLNPYGIGIYQEVAKYFTETFFKQHITEWLPVYATPVYARSLVFIAIALIIFFLALKRRRLTMPQILLFVAFLVAGIGGKRNMILFVLVATPLVAGFGETMANWIAKKLSLDNARFYMRIICVFGCMALALATCANALTFKFKNIWTETEVLAQYNAPISAIRFLAKKTGAPKYIFNYFEWGGTLTWLLPSDKIFLSGSGTATWRRNNSETLLGEYFFILNKPGGLVKLMNSPAQYALLPLSKAKTTLGADLDNSPDWKRVMSDDTAIIWQRLK